MYYIRQQEDDTLTYNNNNNKHQLATSWLILEGVSPSILARLERPAIYFKGFLFWCSALMLFCCMTVGWQLTARTDDRTHLCIA